MKIKLASGKKPKYVVNFSFVVDGETFENRENDVADQVTAEITLASTGQKERFVEYVTEFGKGKKSVSKSKTIYNRKAALRECCGDLTGLSEFGITDGKSLVAFKMDDPKEVSPTIEDIKADLFFAIIGVEEDEEDEDLAGE